MNEKKLFDQATVDTNRRSVLKGACAGMLTTPLLSQMLAMTTTRAALAAEPQSDFKALVCLFLFGGNDSHNMLAPMEPSEFADYQTVRTNIALPEVELQPNLIFGSSNPASPQFGRRFAFHPSLPKVTDLYRSGSLAVVGNVGTLVQPLTIAQYESNQYPKPVGLFSHSSHQRNWQTAMPQSRDALSGWAGRMAEILSDTANSNPALSINYSIDGENLMLTGDQLVPFVLNRGSGARLMDGYGGNSVLDRILTRATDSITSATYANLLQQSYAQTKDRAIDGAIEYNLRVNEIELATQFPSTGLGQEFERAAKTIAAQAALGQSRQLFFIGDGNWDNHQNLLTTQQRNLEEVDDALKAFHDAVIELGCQGQVTTFLASDFARTLTSNGRGSDHAWGGNMLVMGPGAVNGGEIYGEYPITLATGGPLDIGRGRLLPTVSTDQYYGELASWFGVSGSSVEMEQILPNVRNFWDGTNQPIGFMA
ncbi:MAG: DUF1501 domain-containing protein [Pseudomonadota bacterium]